MCRRAHFLFCVQMFMALFTKHLTSSKFSFPSFRGPRPNTVIYFFRRIYVMYLQSS